MNLGKNKKESKKEKYTLRVAEGEDYYRTMMVNETLKNFNKKHLYVWFLYISIDIKDKTEKFNLPTNDEALILNSIEDNFETLINSTVSYKYIGRITNNGKRDIYYYIAEPKEIYKELIQIIESGTYIREFEFSISEDPCWEEVNFFFDY